MIVKACVAGVLAFALFACHESASVELPQAQTNPTISDTVKFPGENLEVVKMVSAINDLVNERMVYISDPDHYGRDEMWVMTPPDGKGDCEDFALTKMELLRESGVPVIAVARVRGVLVTEGGKLLGAHAILELLLPNGAHAFLDNRYDELMTRSELERDGYQFFDW